MRHLGFLCLCQARECWYCSVEIRGGQTRHAVCVACDVCVCVWFQDTLLKCSKLFLVAGCTDSSSWESEHARNSASGRGGPDHRWCSFSILNILQIYRTSFSLRNISFLLTALPLSRDVAQSQLLLLEKENQTRIRSPGTRFC